MLGMTMPTRSRSPGTRAFNNRDGTGSPPRRWRGDWIGPPFHDGAATEAMLIRMAAWKDHRMRPIVAGINIHRDNYTPAAHSGVRSSPDGSNRGTTVLH